MRGLAPLAAALLAACQAAEPPPPPPPPPPATEPVVQRPASSGPSAESRELSAAYARLERDLLARGLLRRDGGGVDTAYGAGDLARIFEALAFSAEFTQESGRLVTETGPARLHRWRGPVRIQLHFGASAAPALRRADAALIERYATRLARATRHPVSVVPSGGNFHVFVSDIDEQRTLAPAIRRAAPGLGRSGAQGIASLDRSIYCTVYAWAGADDPQGLVGAVAFVRTEHPDLSRRACYHEEIAQGLGLLDDDPAARPSIFNDDDEFALLTTLDEQLLRILYDPRLAPGVPLSEARPTIRAIAAELVPRGPV